MRISYAILLFLKSENALNKLRALTQDVIVNGIEMEDGKRWGDRTIYNKLRQLIKLGYIKEGLRKGNSNTFYIVQAGLDWMIAMEDTHNQNTEGINKEIEFIQFTNSELSILSDAILCLISSTSQAEKLVYDNESIEKLENAMKRYRELNTKICKAMN